MATDFDCGEMECQNGHLFAFSKELHRFSCEGDGCSAPPTTAYCPWCNNDTIASDESGHFCTAGICYCSDDYDLCLENRIAMFQIAGLELCDGDTWQLDFDWVMSSWVAALERGIVTEDEYNEGIREASDYFDQPL